MPRQTKSFPLSRQQSEELTVTVVVRNDPESMILIRSKPGSACTAKRIVFEDCTFTQDVFDLLENKS